MSDDIPGMSGPNQPDPLLMGLLAAARIGLEPSPPLWLARDLVTGEALADGDDPAPVAGEALRELRRRYDALRLAEGGAESETPPPAARGRTPGASEGATG